MSTNPNVEEPNLEAEPSYSPSAADLACLEALLAGGSDEKSLRTIDPILWLRGSIGRQRGLYAGQISIEEIIHIIETTKGTPWQTLTDDEIRQNFFG